MSLIDDLKVSLEKTSMKKCEVERVIAEISKKYGGSKWYIRRRKVGLTFNS